MSLTNHRLQLFRDEFLEIWFQSIVARKLTAQHSLTSALLNVDRVSPLLETLPFDRNEETGRFAIGEDEFEIRRLDALAGEFVPSYRRRAIADPLSTGQLRSVKSSNFSRRGTSRQRRVACPKPRCSIFSVAC